MIVNLNRKAVLISRMLQAIEEYVKHFKKPVPMKVLSARFAKALGEVGGFPETMHELQSDGTLEIVLTEGGARRVCLAGQLIRLTEPRAQ